MYKCVIFDLDDTILHKDKSLSLFSIETLKTLQNKGIFVVINSARDFLKTKPVMDAIKPDYTILDGGGLVVDKDENVKYEKVIDINALKKVCSFALKENLKVKIEAREGTFTNQKDRVNEYEKFIDLNEDVNLNAYKVVICCFDNNKLQNFCNENDLLLTRYFTGVWYRITNKMTTKLEGNKEVCKLIGINLSDVICFGDDNGDIEMLSNCGKGVCMANSQISVLNAIKEHCLSNEEDGVAKYLTKEFNL
jgi:Cof subfamily protein (haloacid dehalogenase superfamily)